MAKIKNGFDKLSDSELETKTDSIIGQLTNNPHFLTPSPTLVEMKSFKEAFHVAHLAAIQGDRAAVAEKNAAREVLISKLHLLGNYVMFTAEGDEVALSTSGFDLVKPPAPKPPVTKPEGIALEDGPSAGELLLKFNKVPGARSYQYEYTPDPVLPESNWQVQTGTVRKNLFAGLESGKRYWCRVAAVGNNKQLVYSDPVSRVTQ